MSRNALPIVPRIDAVPCGHFERDGRIRIVRCDDQLAADAHRLILQRNRHVVFSRCDVFKHERGIFCTGITTLGGAVRLEWIRVVVIQVDPRVVRRAAGDLHRYGFDADIDPSEVVRRRVDVERSARTHSSPPLRLPLE